jgi:hypothetical protein
MWEHNYTLYIIYIYIYTYIYIYIYIHLCVSLYIRVCCVCIDKVYNADMEYKRVISVNVMEYQSSAILNNILVILVTNFDLKSLL